jgi:uncharacterized integral membrane protein (TIGR00698 family)
LDATLSKSARSYLCWFKNSIFRAKKVFIPFLLISGYFMKAKILFILGIIFLLTSWASPPIGLGLGLMIGLTFGNPFGSQSQKISKALLQICVVGLGFSMNLSEVLKVSRSGFVFTILGIGFVLSFGYLLGKLLRVKSKNSYLISVGTAICGGSAIAAVGPVVNASDEEMSISLGTVFILNSVALIIFPLIGNAVGLSQEQFGLWAALAIHDTSSVVGAGLKYGAVALGVATTVKLARALWIAPVALLTAVFKKSKSPIKYPYFILLFILAAFTNTYLPVGEPLYANLTGFAKIGLIVTLYLIGSNISKVTLKVVGVRPLLQGVILWLVVSALSLWLIYSNLIGL